MTTIATQFAGREEPINIGDYLPFALGNIVHDAHELSSGKVADLAPPKGLHSLHGKVFKVQIVVAVGQVMRQFEEVVTTTINHTLMDARDFASGLVPVVGKFYFSRKVALCLGKVVKRLFQKKRRVVFCLIRCLQEGFKSEVEPNGDVTLPVGNCDVFLNHKVDVQITKRITLNRDGLDVSRYLTAFAELIDAALNTNLVTTKQFPTSLLEREARILLHFLELWWGSLDTGFQIAEEQFVCTIDALDYILNGLTANHAPEGILGQFLELGDVLHQRKLTQVLTRQLIVATMQRNAVIPDNPRYINLLIEMPRVLAAI